MHTLTSQTLSVAQACIRQYQAELEAQKAGPVPRVPGARVRSAGKLQERINILKKLAAGTVTPPPAGDCAGLGSEVILQQTYTGVIIPTVLASQREVQILSRDGIDNGIISVASRLGEVMLGKKAGDTVQLDIREGWTVMFRIQHVDNTPGKSWPFFRH